MPRRLAQQTGRPLEYLRSSSISKDARAREILTRDAIAEGLVCIFSCVESCMTLTVRGDRATKRLRLVRGGAPVCVSVLLLRRPGLRADARPAANLVAADRPGLCQRPRMARPAIDRGRARRMTQQDNALIPDDFPRRAAISDRLPAFAWEPWLTRYARPGQSLDRWPRRPVPRLLLERARKRVCHRCDLRHRRRISQAHLSPAAASCHRALHDRGPAALPGTGACPAGFKARPTVRWSIGPKASASVTGSMRIRSRCTTKRRVSCAWK